MNKTIKMIFIFMMFVFLMFSITLCGDGDTDNNTNSDIPMITISNLINNCVVDTGFIIGKSSDDFIVTSVYISIDEQGYDLATGTINWRYRLPCGSNSWKENSEHMISVRAMDNEGNLSDITTNRY